MRALCLLTSAALFACATERPATSPAPAETSQPVKVNAVAQSLAAGVTLDADDPATCGVCHTAVFTEWQDSLHSRSHHSRDPLYAAMRTFRLQKQGPQIPGQCAGCHNPNDGKDFESKAAQTGVSCATCHQLDGVHLGEGRKGTAALVKGAEKTFRGPHDIPNGTSPLHATGAALPAVVDGTSLCQACHEQLHNASGIPSCTTGVEYQSVAQAQSCAQCHMPLVETPSGPVSTRPTHRSHRFLGPHLAQRSGDLSLLNQAVALSGRFEGTTLVVQLLNRSAHAFPTGFPARMVVVEVRALDATGKEVFRNVTSKPMEEHPEAVLNKGYADAEGKPALAPFAVKLVRDTRLLPAERRELTVALPASAVKAELALRFFLAGPMMTKALAYTGPESLPLLLAPVVVTR